MKVCLFCNVAYLFLEINRFMDSNQVKKKKKIKIFPELKLCFIYFFAAKHWFRRCVSQRRLLWRT